MFTHELTGQLAKPFFGKQMEIRVSWCPGMIEEMRAYLLAHPRFLALLAVLQFPGCNPFLTTGCLSGKAWGGF